VLRCAVIPIHLNSKYLADNTASGQQFAKSNLMALTMGNLEPEAKTLWWVHRLLALAIGAQFDLLLMVSWPAVALQGLACNPGIVCVLCRPRAL
jgi:hypothetical protein